MEIRRWIRERRIVLRCPTLGFDGRLVLSSQTPRADFDSLWSTINRYGGNVNVGQPTRLGVPFGVANIVTRLS